MSIDEISLADPTDPARPAEKVLTLSVVGDLAFVSVTSVTDGNPTTTSTVDAEMVVSLPTLRDAVVLLCQDRDRESCRPKDERGNLLPDLAGKRWVQVPV
jgi:hypothetical protein